MPRRKAIQISNEGQTHAIMGIDPGGTTGIAACYVSVRPTMKETMLAATRKKSIEVPGDYLSQGKQIASLMNGFMYKANVENEIPLSNIHFAIEDFVLRRRMEGGATGNLTSCWVAAAAVAIFGSESNIKWRQASQAKTYATDARLKLWGLWTVGSAHQRDAWRHLASEVNEVVG